MDAKAILWPMGALVGLTFIVLLQIPLRRFRAGFARRVNYGDFRYGESANVPGDVSLPNRNYMNLLELPVLFYVLCLSLHATAHVTAATFWLAWAYVAFRALHSVVHLTYNNVRHRGLAFAASNIVLAVMWVRFYLAL
jgi:hypothetical protein